MSSKVIKQGDAGDFFYMCYSGSFEAYVDGDSPASRNAEVPGEEAAVEAPLKTAEGYTILQEIKPGDG